MLSTAPSRERRANLPLVRFRGAGYTWIMNPVFAILVALALLSVLAVLFAGIFSMARGGEFSKKYGNRLMRWRVILQGLAIVLLALAVLVGKD